MTEKKITIEDINNLLPQTQCGLCGYAGCRPYAEAIVNKKEKINKCLPGGVFVLNTLGKKLKQDISNDYPEMLKTEKPRSRVRIDPDSCIGCVKCIRVCPVDAIIGSAKKMHAVIPEDCTGCDLCIPACPVDCIHVEPLAPFSSLSEREQIAKKAQENFERRQKRLQALASAEKKRYADKINTPKTSNTTTTTSNNTAAKNYLAAVLARQKKQPE